MPMGAKARRAPDVPSWGLSSHGSITPDKMPLSPQRPSAAALVSSDFRKSFLLGWNLLPAHGRVPSFPWVLIFFSGTLS